MKYKKILLIGLAIVMFNISVLCAGGWFNNQYILQDPDDSTRLAEFDNKFQVPVVIDVEHHEIHEGNTYIIDVSTIGTSVDFSFKTSSSTKKVHMIFQWAAESKAHIELYEGRTWSAGSGSTATIYNRDRNSLNNSQIQENTTGTFATNMFLVVNSTGQAGGNIIHDEYVWSDKKETNRNRDINEFILKVNETYVAKVTSDDGNKGLHIVLHWYEHTDE